ncbi:(2Fe-2S)-binding protein [Phenylobacterium sp.]|uniref:(2Fe-2S)-binding protein n=1 Tax=Phenylobacterium sp. TaxID=1871053 RepID=UPI0039C9578A
MKILRPGAAATNMYVCNCNGIRERQVRAAIAAGAGRPAQIFKACDTAAQCARCVCDMRKILDEERQALRYAAE